MKVKRINMTLPPEVYELGRRAMRVRMFPEFSGYVQQLIREDAERRGFIVPARSDQVAPVPPQAGRRGPDSVCFSLSRDEQKVLWQAVIRNDWMTNHSLTSATKALFVSVLHRPAVMDAVMSEVARDVAAAMAGADKPEVPL